MAHLPQSQAMHPCNLPSFISRPHPRGEGLVTISQSLELHWTKISSYQLHWVYFSMRTWYILLTCVKFTTSCDHSNFLFRSNIKCRSAPALKDSRSWGWLRASTEWVMCLFRVYVVSVTYCMVKWLKPLSIERSQVQISPTMWKVRVLG